MEELIRTVWHHAPEHRFIPGGCYMITASTLYGRHLFPDSDRLRKLQQFVFDALREGGWTAIAWAVMSSHYHLIALAPSRGWTLQRLVQTLHSKSAIWLNAVDGTPERIVWYQCWDRCLTFEASYWARLNYVNQNPVRHGIVPVASQYPFCSARYYEAHTSLSFQRRVASYRFDRVKEPDEFEAIWLG
jgi:putative transposase